ncbi:hypothetical protein ACFOOK_00935 [Micromonospora krabiensis]|uniref:ABC-2 type transport system permease protein n=1 Tax=Micromonospora krabiensis TaxID=307121 RepID=A0A1C3MXM5_9ACTN|nr:hypothetical protein [Micromonospora krabiensis]SBV25054.1 hypothetical protein GA0070620_0523 [Micromonospora krabiensis]
MTEKTSGAPAVLPPASGRRRPAPSWMAVLVAAVLVAVIAKGLASFNSNYYEVWIYNDAQTGEEQREQVMVDVFMTHTSGFFWGQLVALLLGAFLAVRLRGLPRALAAALSAGLVLAAVDVAVAWHSSADSRRALSRWAERSPGEFPADLLSDDRFLQVLIAGLALFPVAAIAGVGLGTLIAPLRHAPAVALASLAVIATVSYGVLTAAVGWIVATGEAEPVALLILLALLPPAAATPAVVRTAVGDHGEAFTLTMMISGLTWALLLVSAGWLMQRRGNRSAR